MAKAIWRVCADEWTDSEVEKLARRENRSLSNMVVTLCKRQLEAMRAEKLQAEARSTEHAALVSAIRGQAEPVQ